MTTVAFTCGGECDLTHWSAKAYTTADSTHVRSGTYAVRVNTSGGVLGYATYNTTNQRVYVARVAVYFGTLQNLSRIIDLYVQTAANYFINYKDADQKLYFGNGTNEIASTNTVSAGNWYVIDLSADMSANPHVLAWRINGTAQTGLSPAIAADYFQRFSLGSPAASTSQDHWYDDAVLSFAAGDYPIPDGSTTGSAPEVWTPASSAPTWTTPADTVSMSTTPDLKFNSPSSAAKQHFYMQLDTANTFNTGNLRTYDSSTSQTNWTYWDGSAWQALPSDGLPIAKAGNEIDYTVTSALSSATWYRRVRAGTLG